MKAVLFVSGDEESRKLLIMLKNRIGLGEKLKKVKIDMKLKGPYLAIGSKKKKGYDTILSYLVTPQNRKLPPPIKRNDFSYEDHAYSYLASGDSRKQVNDEDVDDEIKSKKKIQYDEQYKKQIGRLENPTKPPKKIPAEYQQSLEEQKDDDLMSYYNNILNAPGD